MRDICFNTCCAQAPGELVCCFTKACLCILVAAASHLQDVSLLLLCPFSKTPACVQMMGVLLCEGVWCLCWVLEDWDVRAQHGPSAEGAVGHVLLCVTFDRSATYAASHCRPGLSSESASSLSQHEVKPSLGSGKAEKQQMEPINLPPENRSICGHPSPSKGRVGTGPGCCMHAGKISGQPIINPECISSHKMLDVPSERLLKSLICSWHSFSIAGSKKTQPERSDIS